MSSAQNVCRQHGGQLTSIQNGAESKFAFNLFNNNFTEMEDYQCYIKQSEHSVSIVGETFLLLSTLDECKCVCTNMKTYCSTISYQSDYQECSIINNNSTSNNFSITDWHSQNKTDFYNKVSCYNTLSSPTTFQCLLITK